MASDPDRLLTPQEVAQLLHVSPSWVAERARRGLVPHCRLGRYVRFTAEDVERIIAAHRQAA